MKRAQPITDAKYAAQLGRLWRQLGRSRGISRVAHDRKLRTAYDELNARGAA